MEFSSDMTIIALSNPGELILPVCPKTPLVTTPSPTLVTTPPLPIFPPPSLPQACVNPEDLSCPICGTARDLLPDLYCTSAKGLQKYSLIY